MTEDFETYEFVEPRIADRFRGFLPVVVDVETGGFNRSTDALLEIAAVMIEMTPIGELRPGATHRYHVQPFHGSRSTRRRSRSTASTRTIRCGRPCPRRRR